ncbi:hypothetical protein QVD17_17378 [Tagetes erecta]|uniref:Glutamate receptor n=1 Tax=Tagetes erecta TaxID=13708 RepID=A0AAD8KSY4_TARER|nr:hypothetical protein QVD17_17378 [Tagetes erecta]
MKLRKVLIPLVLSFLRFLDHGLCTQSFLPENSSIFIHEEVIIIRVGIVLDMDSWIGKSIHSFMTYAISDFYASNINYKTRIVLHTRDSKGDPSQALSAVHDLVNNIKVKAILGPETCLEAKLLAPIAKKAKVPIFSFADSPPMNYRFLFQIKEDASIMSKSITTLVDSFGWKEVNFLYEDVDCGREILSYFLESFQDNGIKVGHRSPVHALSTDDQITQELLKIKISHTTLFVLHMSSLLASRVILIAKRLAMVSEEYAWIVIHKTIDILQPADNQVIDLVSREVSVLAIWAYDTIWALAESFQRLGVRFSFDVTQMKLMLQYEVSNTRFKGVSGEFQLNDGKLVSNGFKIVNMIGNGETSSSVISTKRRMLQAIGGKKLKVGVLTRRKFKYFIDAEYDIQKNVTTTSGFSVDVFNASLNALPYEVLYDLIPFANETYDDLIQKVYAEEIDAILGDSTILTNRSQFVDFTTTYTDMGIGTLAKINHNDMWIFLKPLDVDLWLITATFAILTAFVVWAIESMDQGSQKTPAQQIGATFWFILMTLFFVQREKLSSKLSKFVVFIWLLVVLILISSYTATLTSLLTVEQFELSSKGGTMGFHGGSFVGGRTVNNLHFEDYRHRPYYSYEDYAEALSKGGKHGGADAIIDEIPYIKMFLSMYSADYAMISSEPTTSGLGFIFRKGSPLASDMSTQIAKMREDGTLSLLEKKWFEKQSSSSQEPPSKPKTLNFSRFRGLFLISGISSTLALMISIIFLLRAKLEVHTIISFILQQNLMANLRHILYRNAIRI